LVGGVTGGYDGKTGRDSRVDGLGKGYLAYRRRNFIVVIRKYP
jgi:hypothetical protein